MTAPDATTDDVTAREFTPSMQRLRDEYVQMRAEHYGFSDLYAEEFDRALAERDARVRAEAAAEALRLADFEIRGAKTIPIAARAAICAVLRGRADRVERGESR